MAVGSGVYMVIAMLSYAILGSTAHPLHCSAHVDAGNLAFRMLDSNIARGQGRGNSTTLLSQIELGIFQQALRESINSTHNRSRKDEWRKYLQSSVSSQAVNLSVVSTDVGLPLDRLSVGTSMIYQDHASRSRTFSADISALKESVVLQKRNSNGGMWYYDNQQNLGAYHNLSYLDGMFSYPPFAVLAANHFRYGVGDENHGDNESFGLAAAYEQFQVLYDICKTSDGLLVHGYDASKAHAWANPETGASPVVWARSLSWYTVGLLNSLEVSQSQGHATAKYAELKQIFVDLSRAQVAAAERSQSLTGRHGVWQVVDRPGAVFSGYENFVEASASCMTVFTLLRGVRLGIVEDKELERRATAAAMAIYQEIRQQYLTQNRNGTLSLNGTSDIASLSGNVNDEARVQYR